MIGDAQGVAVVSSADLVVGTSSRVPAKSTTLGNANVNSQIT